MLSVIDFALLCGPFLLSVMLLPAFIEMRKPVDAGPRIIMNNRESLISWPIKLASLYDIEDNFGICNKTSSAQFMNSFFGFLLNLEK
jgi:hypothetical protein